MADLTSEKINALFDSLGIKREPKAASAVSILISIAFLFFFCIPFFSFLNAWVVMSFWNWFLVPAGLAAISYPIALGITTLFGYLKFKQTDLKQDEKTTAKYLVNPILTAFTDVFLVSFVRIMGTYLIGYFISLFI